MVKLGTKVKDSITGFEGIAITRCEYLNGCISIEVRPEGLTEDGKMQDSCWIDEQQLDDKSETKVGGPGNIPPSLSRPH